MLWVSTVPGRIIITQSQAKARGMAGGYTHVVQIVWGAQLKYLHAKGDLFEHGYQLSRITGAAKAPHRQQQQELQQ